MSISERYRDLAAAVERFHRELPDELTASALNVDDPLQLGGLPHLMHREPFTAHLGGQVVATRLDHVDPTFPAEPLADLVARTRRGDERQPVL